MGRFEITWNRRHAAKRDRTARLLKTILILEAHATGGITAAELAPKTDVNLRTVYRDLRAIELEMELPLAVLDGERYCFAAPVLDHLASASWRERRMLPRRLVGYEG